MKFSVLTNVFVLTSMVAVGAYNWEGVEASQLVFNIPEEEKLCLQKNIFFESRNQSSLGQVAVAWVTLNRVESEKYPDTICDVVWQKSAFSWTNDGKPDITSTNTLEQAAWKQAELTANSVLLNWTLGSLGPVGNATMFHADYVNPYWAETYTRVVQIDNHVFYE